MATPNKDGANPHTPTRPNDKGSELLDVIIGWYRGNRNCFTSAEATTLGTEITNILNNTTRV